MRPAMTAAVDQADAAGREAWNLFAGMAELGGMSYAEVRHEGPVGRVLDRLVQRAADGTLGRCPHLSGGAEVGHWAAWRPGRLRCVDCLTAATDAVRDTDEDHTCDCCRRRSRGGVIPSVVEVPAVVVDLGDQRAPLISGPVLGYLGLCGRCHRRAKSAGRTTAGAAR